VADLLLELFSEEIPARMQKNASDALKSLLEDLFKASELSFQAVDTYSTPRRLAAHVTGLPAKTPDINEEKRGPKVGAPDQAVAGFSKSAGVSPDQLVETDGYYYAKIAKKGAATTEVLSNALPGLIAKFPWPKSMRWGEGTFRWVRPLHSILCILDGKVVPFEVDGVKSGNITEGHRFMSEGSFAVKDFANYKHQLNKHYVMLDPKDRKKVILAEAEKEVKKQGVELQTDAGLLNEVAGLVEWPVVLIGSFDAAFLDIPPEALISEMRHHQKYFPVRDARSGKLANKFIFVSNMVATDGGKAIVAGNERVLSARLHDAKFFWDQDRKVGLEGLMVKALGILFFEELGTISDKVVRVSWLAEEIAGYVPGADPKKVKRAAELCKADLASGMVAEFPDLQGIMGYYYAKAQEEDTQITLAIRDHYLPQGPSDSCPSEPVSVALALADKFDSLIGFMAKLQQVPTGSKDPYALRRMALGIIRLVLENNIRLPLRNIIGLVIQNQWLGEAKEKIDPTTDAVLQIFHFFIDRLKVQQKEKGVRHDLIDAVFSVGGEDDLVRLLARVTALQDFLKTKDGEILLYSYTRAVNIVRIEEKKDGRSHSGKINTKLLKEKEEIALYKGLEEARDKISRALDAEKFGEAMAAVAVLRKPIDAFFDKVTVNVEDEKLRANRLRLLSGIREALLPVADFSKIEG